MGKVYKGWITTSNMKLKDILDTYENKSNRQVSFIIKKRELKKYGLSVGDVKELEFSLKKIKGKKIFKCEKCKKFYSGFLNDSSPFVCGSCEEEIIKKEIRRVEIKRREQKQKEYNKKYILEYNKKPENIIKRKEYHQRLDVKKKRMEYEKENKEIIQKRKKEYMKKYMNGYIKNRRKNDLGYAIGLRLRASLNLALKKYSETGKIMSSKKYGIDYKGIIEHLKPFPKDIENYHIDHIKPLSSFNLNNSEEVKKAFDKNNLQWLTIEENRKKGSKITTSNSENLN